MPGIGHFGVGLAAKRVAHEVPLGILLLASEATDLLYGGLALARVETPAGSPWSHSLLTSAGLAAVTGLAAARRYRSSRAGLTLGGVVFSHWLLDFLAWKKTLPLLFAGSPKVGLGLYGVESGKLDIKPGPVLIAIELGLPLLGLALYLDSRGAPGRGCKPSRAERRVPEASQKVLASHAPRHLPE
jgi:hypothetical protein